MRSPSIVSDAQDYTVRLEIFEGPMDLLLHLIRQQEIDIYDIPIARITDQYLQHLQMMRELNVTVAGEYLVMAATLIYIKSRMLLPQDPEAPAEDLDDPRKELVERLLEYEQFKNAAQMLYSRETVELSVWSRGYNEFEQEEKEVVSATVFDLITAFHNLVERFKEQIVVTMEPEKVTLEEKLFELRTLLKLQGELLFSSFFQRGISRSHLVVTFLALLELARLREVRLRQVGECEDIRIVAC